MSKLKLTIDLENADQVHALRHFANSLGASLNAKRANQIFVNEPEIVEAEKPEINLTLTKRKATGGKQKAEQPLVIEEPKNFEGQSVDMLLEELQRETDPASTEAKLDRVAIRAAMDPKKEKHQVALVEKLRELMADEPDTVTRNVSNLPESKFEEFFAFIQSLD